MSFKSNKGTELLFTKTNRNDRFKQMTKQQQLIEEKKRQIQEKLEEQKRKEAEEKLKKIQTSESKSGKKSLGLPSSRWRSNFSKSQNQNNDSDPSQRPANIFTNDGTFLDQFRKLSGIEVPRGSGKVSDRHSKDSSGRKSSGGKDDNKRERSRDRSNDRRRYRESSNERREKRREERHRERWGEKREHSASPSKSNSCDGQNNRSESKSGNYEEDDDGDSCVTPSCIPRPSPLVPQSIPRPTPLPPHSIPPPSPLVPQSIPPPPLSPESIPAARVSADSSPPCSQHQLLLGRPPPPPPPPPLPACYSGGVVNGSDALPWMPLLCPPEHPPGALSAPLPPPPPPPLPPLPVVSSAESDPILPSRPLVAQVPADINQGCPESPPPSNSCVKTEPTQHYYENDIRIKEESEEDENNSFFIQKEEEDIDIKQEPDSDKMKSDRGMKRKSRWGDSSGMPSVKVPPVQLVTPVTLSSTPTINVTGMTGHMISKVTRSDPGLLQYALNSYKTTNLSEEDWKKAEDNYKIHLLYQDMLRKRAEVERLSARGKHKYEYDSDEEVDGGTWEHKAREKEMLATREWAESLTEAAKGKHHIGDFLPPEELKKFLEKYNALKGGQQPDLSDYKEYKLKEDNKGFQMLQKLGWSEGQGLGSDGSGIVDPINKAKTRDTNQGLGVVRPDDVAGSDDEYDAYRKRMMLAYRFRPNPLNNPRRPYY